jgi:acetyl-CoA carboxylase biotin carboxyl carrier protein
MTSANDVQSVLTWMKQTDLVEVLYRKEGATLSLRIEDAEAPVDIPPSVFVPVTSPAVGVFRLSSPGRAPEARKGAAVKRGAKLGVVESGSKRIDIEAPADGRVAELLAEEGMAVEYGRPLFLIEPN